MATALAQPSCSRAQVQKQPTSTDLCRQDTGSLAARCARASRQTTTSETHAGRDSPTWVRVFAFMACSQVRCRRRPG